MITFQVDDEQTDKYLAWRDEHQKTCKLRPGSIGDLFHFRICPTGIGNFISVHCACGEGLDLNDYDKF